MLNLGSNNFQSKAIMQFPPNPVTQNPYTEKAFDKPPFSQSRKSKSHSSPNTQVNQTISTSDMAHAHSDIIIYHYLFFFFLQYRLTSRQNKPLMQEQLWVYFWRKDSFVRLQTSHLAKALCEVFTCGYSDLSCGLTEWASLI